MILIIVLWKRIVEGSTEVEYHIKIVAFRIFLTHYEINDAAL